jgi:hypothetical protein
VELLKAFLILRELKNGKWNRKKAQNERLIIICESSLEKLLNFFFNDRFV